MNTEERLAKIESLLNELIGMAGYKFQRNIQIFDARNIQTGKTNGTTIATATDQKVGFHGSASAQAGAITAPSGGGTVDSQARAAINSIITALKNKGITG